MLADSIIRWTARLFVACYLGRVAIDVAGRRDAVSQFWARAIWTVGFVLFLLHTAAAFHLLHGWSHDAACEHVLKRTTEATGFETGVGIYVNYGFGLLWLADVLMWWRDLRWTERRIPYWIVHVTFAFLILQATAVFGPAFWIPVAIVVVLGLIGVRASAVGRARR